MGEGYKILHLDCDGGYTNTCNQTAQNHTNTHTHTQMSAYKTGEI